MSLTHIDTVALNGMRGVLGLLITGDNRQKGKVMDKDLEAARKFIESGGKNLSDLLIACYGNMTAASRIVNVDRGTIRRLVKNKVVTSILVSDEKLILCADISRYE